MEGVAYRRRWCTVRCYIQRHSHTGRDIGHPRGSTLQTIAVCSRTRWYEPYNKPQTVCFLQQNESLQGDVRDITVSVSMKRPLLELVLASGFFAVAFAIAMARLQPATTYEVSIYTGTPTGSWIGLAIGLAIAVGVALSCRGPYQIAGIGLGSLAVTVIVGLPVRSLTSPHMIFSTDSPAETTFSRCH